ncbi:hypothetical protein [Fibrobacter sp.]|uniref:hypothetical protein n=1 Tax=Fibrobacter sp. TaxID=35828 RepID=UPI0026107CC3|nr:hypothetical protein [Fibrobacter sp.]MDD5942351.1 hypothetical protein [Fibrobacter sp.]
MKTKYLIFAIAFAIFCAGCSEKKEKSQDQQQTDVPATKTSAKKKTKAKNPKIPLDSSQILTYKDIDQSDSIMVGIRAFDAAEKEFVKRWNYAKDTDLFIDIVGKICRESRKCASRLDSVAYKNDVASILDSLMHNNLLDAAVEARIQEMNGPCFGDNYNKNKKKCDEESEERVRKMVIEDLKRNREK